MHHLKIYKIFGNNRVKSKHFKLKNVNWSYVPTHIMSMTPVISRMHILFKPLSIWAIFVALDAPSKFYKILWKCKDNKVTSKDLKLQNANWSYVPTHIMPMTPFTWRRHILLKPSSIWTIFVELDARSKGLQNVFELPKQ
jgi:hypothetical protein